MMNRLMIASCLGGALLLAACDDNPGTDAGPMGVDAGDPGMDSGEAMMDAGPPALDCTLPAGDDLWTPPDGLPAFTAADRGRVLKCGTTDPIDAATVDARARAPFALTADDPGTYDGPTLTEGATRTLVLYRSERRNGEGGVSSGTLYLPSSGATDLPLLVHVSGTTGLGDDCAPSRGRFTDLERTLYVLLGTGHAVFVPDLIGLGTPGTLAYLESAEAAHATLDGARAALSVAPDGALSGEVLISGHSAGGHAALVSQALQRTYAPELNLIGVSAMAGVWFDTAVFGELMTVPAYATSGDDGWNVVYGAMYFVGHAAAYDGEDHAYDMIRTEQRDAIRNVFENYCLIPPMVGGTDMRQALQMAAANVGEIFDPSFSGGFASRVFCDAGLMDRCPAHVATWIERFANDRPPLDPEGAPVWFHQGSLDVRSTVESMRCPIAEADYNGVDSNVCFYMGVEHTPLAGVVAPWLADWVDALGAGSAAPACLDSTPWPAAMPSACGLGAPMDGGMAPVDAGTDAGMMTVDAGSDAGAPDAGVDAGVDAGP
ncbi:MAG: hypothetical protein H6719_26880 [Sandaracinaceae bacterium]|nr:hypothetical protein [Sandaracinaceae bacterium]